MPPWSINSSLSLMAQNSISTSIVSLSAPAFSIIPDLAAAARVCRGVNEYSASLHDSYPEKFGWFASVPPLTNTPGAVAEIEYALDIMHADGVILFTSYSEIYLGEKRFEPVWKALNDRKAVVFVHPSQNMNATSVSPLLNPSIVDFTHETTRTAMSLITSGILTKYPDVKIILSHGGGTLPYVATRAGALLGAIGGSNITASRVVAQARNFYFDLALTSFGYPLELLLRFADPKRIIYGSDYPFVATGVIAEQVRIFDTLRLSSEQKEAIMHGNAGNLFPRFTKLQN